MKLPADVIETAKQALGGKNVTAKRLKDMLADYARLKSFSRDGVEASPPPPESDPRATHEFLDVTAGLPSLADMEAAVEGEEPALTGEVQPDIGPHPDPIINALFAELRSMRQEIQGLRKPPTEEEKEAALAAGKLPVPAAGEWAGPVGYTGSASLPQGEWFRSPFGPPIQMKICNCPQCPPHRKVHYFCPICRTGPHDYNRVIGGIKNHLAPGSTWGIQHVMCSIPCWNQYQPLIDGRPRPQVDPFAPVNPNVSPAATVDLPAPRPGLGSD